MVRSLTVLAVAVLTLVSGVAHAASKNVLVFPPGGRESEMEPSDAASLQKAIENDLGPALMSLGYTVLTDENAKVMLQDKKIDVQALRRSDSYLEAARALKLSLFVTSQVSSANGRHEVEVRLFDTASGNMLASGDVEGEDGASLRKSWKKTRDRFLSTAKENLGTVAKSAPAAEEGPSAAELKELRAGCDRSEPSKCLRLGRLYEKGEGVKADAAQAMDYYGRACSGGYPEGCAALRALRAAK